MPAFDEGPTLELGRSPIPGDAPCGIDAADDEQYLVVDAQMTGVDRIEADQPDWYLIEQNTVNILRTKSKDVEMASALGHALFKRYSYAGLAAALGLFTELVKNFWDRLFPERPRRRKARMETLGDRFTEQGWFRESPPKGNDFDAIDVCVARAEELKAALTEKMPDDPPELDKFLRGLKEQAGKRPKAAAPASSTAQSTGATPTAAGGGAAFAAGEMADVGSAVNAIFSAAAFIRKADDADPLPYAVNRIVKWASISLPTSDAAKYEIPPPEAATLEALPHQFNNGLWDHLLKNAEAAFRANDPLWLDLQRWICGAMAGLGPKYDPARHTVMTLTGGLVKRLGDGVFALTFTGGIPLCSGETKLWIESELLPAKAGGGGVGADNGKLSEASDRAKKLAGSGKLKEALQELQGGLLTCTQRRDRLLWRLRIAQLCYDAKKLRLAASLLEDCYEEIKRFHIDEWEPALAVDVAEILYRCRKSLTAGEKEPAEEALQGVRASFAWLCQLDPLAALAAEPSGK